MTKQKRDRKFPFLSRDPKPEKLPSTLKQAQDFRQKRADEGLKKTNLYLLALAALLGGVLIILAIAKQQILG